MFVYIAGPISKLQPGMTHEIENIRGALLVASKVRNHHGVGEASEGLGPHGYSRLCG